jgi:hypothetical protein
MELTYLERERKRGRNGRERENREGEREGGEDREVERCTLGINYERNG